MFQKQSRTYITSYPKVSYPKRTSFVRVWTLKFGYTAGDAVAKKTDGFGRALTGGTRCLLFGSPVVLAVFFSIALALLASEDSWLDLSA